MINLTRLCKETFLFLIICFVPLWGSAQVKDSLWYVWKKAENHDTIRLDAYKDYIWNNYMFYNPDSALILSEDLYQRAEEFNQLEFMGAALNHQAVALTILGKINDAVSTYEKAVEFYLSNDLEAKAGATYSNLGTIYNDKGDLKKSAQYYFKAIKIFEKYNEDSKLARAYNNLGVLYNEQKMFQLSLNYHQKSLVLNRQFQNEKDVGQNLLNIGAVYGDMNNSDLSEQYLDSAYIYINASDDTRALGTYFLNKGHLLHQKRKFDKSLDFYHKALDAFYEVEDKQNVVTTEVHLGGNYLNLEEPDLAAMYLVDAYEKSKDYGIFLTQREASKLLYELYKELKDYKLALFFNEEYYLLNDSLTDLKLQETTLNLKFEHDYEKKAFADSLEFVKSQELNLLRISEQEAQIQKDRTQKYALFGGIGLMLIFGAFAYRTYQRKKRDHDIITLQHHELEESHHEIQQSHYEIQQSIHYSKRLQDVFLPTDELLSHHFESHFVLFKPKDVVSGDFYWFEYDEDSQTKVIAVADCTGHGVPGALVSIVCSSALNKVVKELSILEPAEILNKTREIVIDRFTRAGKGMRDGMDITICVIKGDKIKTAGANNGLWLARKGKEIIEIKANRQPVGWQEKLNPFTQEEITISAGDTIYLLSDGFPDQFGGEKGKKLKKKPLKTYLHSIQSKQMDIQRTLLNDKFQKWRGDIEQVDDVCVIGIRF